MNTYFIGYDAREDEAAKVCAHSITSRDSMARVMFLEHTRLRKAGIFDREWTVKSSGQMVDNRDKRPFSTHFSHSRFLVFWLARELECTGPCMFVDCDFIFVDNPGKLMAQQYDQGDLIGVVNREREVEENSLKMDGMVQQNYHRKLWSAMFTFMPQKGLADYFDLQRVNRLSGRELHGFLGLADNRFWEVDPKWHFIPSLDDEIEEWGAIHFSEFSPWLNPERVVDFPGPYAAYEAARGRWLDAYSEGGYKAPEWVDVKRSGA